MRSRWLVTACILGLEEHGGPIEIGLKWAESFLKRCEYVKTKNTQQLESYCLILRILNQLFLQRIWSEVVQNAIPSSLIVSLDQTGLKLVPVSQWTLAKQGSAQVPVVGKDDKREITVLLAVSASGSLLPPKVINLCWENARLSCKNNLSPGMAYHPKW